MSIIKEIEAAYSDDSIHELLKTNKYFNTNKGTDPLSILSAKQDINMAQGEKFRHTMSVANFIKERNTIDGVSELLVEFLTDIEDDMLMVFINHQHDSVISEMFDNNIFAVIRQRIESYTTSI